MTESTRWKPSSLKPASPVADDEARELVGRVNNWAECDIPIDPAQARATEIQGLPNQAGAIAQLLEDPHSETLLSMNNGSCRLQSKVQGFDLAALCHYHRPDDGTVDLIRRYFERRTVDVATGRGAYEGSYPFEFDWIVVLEPEKALLLSFIFNLQD